MVSLTDSVAVPLVDMAVPGCVMPALTDMNRGKWEDLDSANDSVLEWNLDAKT